MKLELNAEQLNDLIIAAADGERLYRRLRRDVRDGVIDHYTEEECNKRCYTIVNFILFFNINIMKLMLTDNVK